jgi:LysM domain-containing protein
MSIAFELEYEACGRPFRLYALPDQPARVAPSPRVRRVRMVLTVAVTTAVLVLLVLLALPLRQLGGSTLAQDSAARGQEYIVKSGDTLASIARSADPAHPTSLASQLALQVGSTVVVPGEHIQIP